MKLFKLSDNWLTLLPSGMIVFVFFFYTYRNICFYFRKPLETPVNIAIFLFLISLSLSLIAIFKKKYLPILLWTLLTVIYIRFISATYQGRAIEDFGFKMNLQINKNYVDKCHLLNVRLDKNSEVFGECENFMIREDQIVVLYDSSDQLGVSPKSRNRQWIEQIKNKYPEIDFCRTPMRRIDGHYFTFSDEMYN